MKKILILFLICGLQSCSNGSSNCIINAERTDIKLHINGSSYVKTMGLFMATLPDGHSYLITTQYTDGSGSKSLCHDPECSKCKTK